ncbi:hypothetical protein M5K25_024251 [Dendrobium thyrsiflorum]|uniref:Exostosin GT47 domain-containing protein n=1 Tax=Dendrobium thyrsiflorum TaxID=117978 RepID=A0ABD0U1G1_DENTH
MVHETDGEQQALPGERPYSCSSLLTRLLQLALYVPGSHNRTNMRLHLQNYLQMIAAKYPFWNRTGGADHFLAACHDWALYETKNIMDHSIRALCVADLSIGFELGRDVCLPETKLSQYYLKHWENKDPDMKIFGPLAFRVGRSKMTYIQYMKSSKYCICPRGYEVNSPRLVESIFFECVPVIIADNYVPPFFEILNWEKFSVVVPEKDLPKLKEILLSISESEYRELQMGVKKVQRHFLWRTKPVKRNYSVRTPQLSETNQNASHHPVHSGYPVAKRRWRRKIGIKKLVKPICPKDFDDLRTPNRVVVCGELNRNNRLKIRDHKLQSRWNEWICKILRIRWPVSAQITNSSLQFSSANSMDTRAAADRLQRARMKTTIYPMENRPEFSGAHFDNKYFSEGEEVFDYDYEDDDEDQLE